MPMYQLVVQLQSTSYLWILHKNLSTLRVISNTRLLLCLLNGAHVITSAVTELKFKSSDTLVKNPADTLSMKNPEPLKAECKPAEIQLFLKLILVNGPLHLVVVYLNAKL